MATIHHQPYHHSTTTTTTTTATSTPRLRRHSLDYSSLPSSSSSSTFSTLKHSTINHSSRTLTCSATTTTTPTTPTTPTTSTTAFSRDTLERHLANGDYRQADEETRRMLIVLAGEPAIKRGYVFFSEVQFIPKEELKSIDELWRKYSDERFGYSVQKKIWLKSNKDFTQFFKKVGWMKKLDTEIEQFNYRSFPTEFMWELNLNSNNNGSSKTDDDYSDPPEGHLPLTNALRGTQLLNMIFTHPSFDEGDDEQKRKEEDGKFEDGGENNQVGVDQADKKKSRFASLRDRLFKPNYTF